MVHLCSDTKSSRYIFFLVVRSKRHLRRLEGLEKTLTSSWVGFIATHDQLFYFFRPKGETSPLVPAPPHISVLSGGGVDPGGPQSHLTWDGGSLWIPHLGSVFLGLIYVHIDKMDFWVKFHFIDIKNKFYSFHWICVFIHWGIIRVNRQFSNHYDMWRYRCKGRWRSDVLSSVLAKDPR